MIKADQYETLNNQGLNLSGLIRDLIDDYLSEFKITISVSEETRKLYDLIVSNTGSTDDDVEVYFKEALKKLLAERIEEMKKLQKSLEASP